jgi:hypothetical protein
MNEKSLTAEGFIRDMTCLVINITRAAVTIARLAITAEQQRVSHIARKICIQRPSNPTYHEGGSDGAESVAETAMNLSARSEGHRRFHLTADLSSCLRHGGRFKHHMLRLKQ